MSDNEPQRPEGRSLLDEQFYTPNDLAERGIMSHVKQWQERNAKRLGFLRIGRKILYRQRHLDEYFQLCEVRAESDNHA
jgi:hypothetical protein